MSADRLAEGDRCMATISAGLRPQHKKAVITEVLPSGYKVRCDGEEGERRLSGKKVRRLGKSAKKVAPGTIRGQRSPASSNVQQRIDEEGVESVLEAHRAVFGSTAPDAALRDQRPPTRLHIPDANVPAVEPGTPTVLRSGQPDRPVIKLQADSLTAFGVWVMSPQPKPRKPSRSAAYLQHVREHDCCNCGAPGPSDPDHVGPRGVGQKCSDHLTIPLCRPCHRFRTDFNVLPDVSVEVSGSGKRAVTRKFKHTPKETELIILHAQVQMLREWVEKIEKETP